MQDSRLTLAMLLCLSTRWQQTQSIGLYPPGSTEQGGDAPNTTICRDALDNNSDSYSSCEITRYLRGCQFDSGFFQYLTFQYCTFDNRITPTIFMILWLVVLLGAFAIIADSFFSPSIIALAKAMKMSQSLAGVTLLAFGNGAPDVFSAITAITTGDPNAPDEGLGVGFLLGSGFLVNTVTAGLVIIIKPFKMSRRPFIKDSFFYIVAVTWAASILIRRRISLLDSVAFLIIYIIYVTTTWAGGILLRRQRQKGTLFPDPPQCLERVWNSLVTCCRPLTKPLKALPSRGDQGCEEQVSSETKPGGEVESIGSGGHQPGDRKELWNGIPTSLTCNGLAQPQTDTTTTSKVPPPPPLKYGLPSITVIAEANSDQPVDEVSWDQSIRSHSVAFDKVPRGDPTGSRHFLALPGTGRQRASSVDSSIGTGAPRDSRGSRRRLSDSSQGVTGTGTATGPGGGGSSGRSPRSHSISKRQASLRMSTLGTELPYMVRWIILNRGLEEEDLGKKQHISNDLESGHGSAATHPTACDIQMGSISPTIQTLTSLNRPQPLAGLQSPAQQPDLQQQQPTEEFAKSTMGLAKARVDFDSTVREDDRVKESGGKNAEEEYGGDGEEQSESTPVKEDETDSLWLSRWASKGVWHHFVYYMIPIELESWRSQSVFSRILQLIQVPIFMVFRLTIPTVIEELDDKVTDVSVNMLVEDDTETLQDRSPIDDDVFEDEYTSKEGQPSKERSLDEISTDINFENMHGWCKPLNVAQCVLVPTIWPFLLTSNAQCVALIAIGGSPVPLFVPFLFAGAVMALVVYFTSKWEEPPHLYHRPLFATLGFITSIIWIYCLAHELVNALETLGIVFKISEAILGLSIMALASSIGDIMSNGLLARNGYPRIAYSACLGSPVFNLLLGAGLPYTVKIARSSQGVVNVSFNLTQALLFTCLMAVLICNILVAIVCKFHFKRPYGIFLIAVYAMFIIIAILIEVDVIVPPKYWHFTASIE